MRPVVPAAVLTTIGLLLAASIATAAVIEAGARPEAGAALAASEHLRGCGTPEPDAIVLERMRSALHRVHAARPAGGVGGTIQVAFHVITFEGEGAVSDAQIRDQMEALNRGYLGTGYRFSLASIDRTESRRWIKMQPFTGDEKQMKKELAIDPAHRLNVYTTSLSRGLLGWAYLPQTFPENDVMHGVVIHYGSLPGGPFQHYSLGGTLTHEVGHYLGLLHTFQGGCAEPGDFVADTPAEAIPNYECPESRNTCPSPGDDPIHNYMDYSFDECYLGFTPGQDELMDATVPVYRPSLLDAPIAMAPRAESLPASSEPVTSRNSVAFAGAWPNPFGEQAVLRFSLPTSAHVRLRVFDVAGHLVADIVDANMPPGEHSAPFRAAKLPAGLYFASLRVDGVLLNRSLMHVP
jgi:hypothetical protein